MPDYTVQFEMSPFLALDQLASLAMRVDDFGNRGNWFNEFRGGLSGFYARLHGIEAHYAELHAWRPRRLWPVHTEYHLTSIFFHMDSAVECLTFTLNALGWAVDPDGFRDVTKHKSGLREVCPNDVISAKRPGYAIVFPRVQALWQSHTSMLTTIVDLHDVSKHREAIFVSSRARTDAPDGFFESLGTTMEADPLFLPFAEILLKHEPKVPAAQRGPVPVEKKQLLEELVPEFARLVNRSGHAAVEDARANIPLKE